MPKSGWVYLLATQPHGMLYCGVTSHLTQRIHQHKHSTLAGFSHTHACKTLVWYEVHPDIQTAILREKQIKKWRRALKIQLIQAQNPTWADLSLTWFEV